MTQKKYCSIVSVVAILSMLFAMRKYYTTYAYSSVVFILTGVLGILTVCLTAFGILALLNRQRRVLIAIGVSVASCISILLWVFYWIDVAELTRYTDTSYWNDSPIDFDYMTTAISGILQSVGVCVLYFMGYMIKDDRPMRTDRKFPFGSALFLCSLFLIAAIDNPLYYIFIAVIGGVLLTFLYFLQAQRVVFHCAVGILSLFDLVFFILDLAIIGAEPNFVLLAGVVYAIVYAILCFTKAGKNLLVAKETAAGRDLIRQLEDLQTLHHAGILTDEEFQAQKDKILGKKS